MLEFLFESTQNRKGPCKTEGCKCKIETWRTVIRETIFFLFKKRICYAAAAKSLQLCPILCDPIDGSPPGSPIPGTLQARTLEWVAVSFSNA